MLRKDILRTYNLMQGSKAKKIISCYRSKGVHAVVILRFGQWLNKRNILLKVLLTPIYYILYGRIRRRWGIEIPREAEVGEGLYIGHYGGIIISKNTKIGKNVNLSHQITIGVSGKGTERGSPVIGDKVYIAPGAKVFGKIVIGENAKIGANCVVYKDVPDNAILVLDPGSKIVSYKGNR